LTNQTEQNKDNVLLIEKIEVLYGIENTMDRLTEVMARVSNKADVCGDALSPSFSMGVESIKKGYIDLKKEESRQDSLLKLQKIIYITVKS